MPAAAIAIEHFMMNSPFCLHVHRGLPCVSATFAERAVHSEFIARPHDRLLSAFRISVAGSRRLIYAHCWRARFAPE